MIESVGLEITAFGGRLYVAPYVPLFGRSKDFLVPETLGPQARFFADEENLAGLGRPESTVGPSADLPPIVGGMLELAVGAAPYRAALSRS